jgi:hypothetical protein
MEAAAGPLFNKAPWVRYTCERKAALRPLRVTASVVYYIVVTGGYTGLHVTRLRR